MKKLIIFIIAANAVSLILKSPDGFQLIASLTQNDTFDINKEIVNHKNEL